MSEQEPRFIMNELGERVKLKLVREQPDDRRFSLKTARRLLCIGSRSTQCRQPYPHR